MGGGDKAPLGPRFHDRFNRSPPWRVKSDLSCCNHTIVIVACRRRNRRCRAVLLFFERKGCELILYRYI